MHFREQGRSLQLVRTKYDPERHRGVQTVIAKMPLYTYEIPHEVLPLLEPVEAAQLRDYLAAVKAGRDTQQLSAGLTLAVNHLATATRALESGLPPKDADALWVAMAELGKALKAAGHPRPVRPRKAPTTPAGQTALDV